MVRASQKLALHNNTIHVRSSCRELCVPAEELHCCCSSLYGLICTRVSLQVEICRHAHSSVIFCEIKATVYEIHCLS